MREEKYEITGMTCAACQANITRSVQKLPGMSKVDVNLLSNQMQVTYDETKTDSDTIIRTVESIGYGASLPGPAAPKQDAFRSEWESRQNRAKAASDAMKHRLISSVLLLIPLMYIAMAPMAGLPTLPFLEGMENALILALTQLLFTLPIVIINKHFYQSGFKALAKRVPNMDSLVAIGSGASLLYGIIAIYCMAYGFGHNDMDLVHRYAHALYFESSATILTLVTVGKYLEARSKAKTSDALDRLVNLAPKTASVIRNGSESVIPAEQVMAGDIVVIRPGESLPVDGVVTEGHGFVDQSAITGESIPVEKNVGDTVISATTNKNGTFRLQASKVGSDTTLAQIIRLVDEAGNTKAPIARMADKVSGIFVPVVITIALATALIWLLLGMDLEFALTNAISVLVISCPCALGLATPVAIMVGTGKAAEYGILIKSAQCLENLHSVDTVVLDKTGTITQGHPAVTDILPADAALTKTAFLTEAAAIEAGSEHPLALAIMEKAAKQGLSLPTAEDFLAVPGRGISARLGQDAWLAGNLAYIRENGLLEDKKDTPILQQLDRLAEEGKTPLLFYRNGSFAGIIAIADTVRPSSRQAIRQFQKMGLHVIMLTGDNKITAEAIRRDLGIETAISDVLPTDKEACIRSLQEEGRKVAMIGDGINDAPALSRADVGIAIGAGTDIALESADVVLMKNSLYDVVTAIQLSKAVIRNIHQNLFWAFFYNTLGIPVAAGLFYPLWGLLLNPMLGSAAMSLSSVCVVLNALRLRFFKPQETAEADSQEQKAEQEQTTKEQISQEEAASKPASRQSAVTKQAAQQATDTTLAIENASGNPEQKGEIVMKKQLTVEGMACKHCQMHVQNALAAVEGVTEAVVDLDSKKATVSLSQEVSDQVLMDAVTEAGYEPVDCQTL